MDASSSRALWMLALEVFTDRVEPLLEEDRELVTPLHDVPQRLGCWRYSR